MGWSGSASRNEQSAPARRRQSIAGQGDDRGSGFRDRGRRQRRLRYGQPAFRRQRQSRRAARGRAADRQAADQCPRRHAVGRRQPGHQLVLYDRAGFECEWPPDIPVLRQGPRRRIVYQRHGLHQGHAVRLRPVGGGRLHRLELGRGAALLQAVRGFRRTGFGMARKGRPARRLATEDDPSARLQLHGRLPGSRYAADRRLLLRRHRRHFRQLRHTARRQPLQHRRRVPQARAEAAQSGGYHRCDGRPDPVRRHEGARRALHPRWRCARDPGGA